MFPKEIVNVRSLQAVGLTADRVRFGIVSKPRGIRRLSENLLAAIAKSTDVPWLTQCRDFTKTKGNDVVAEAADKRVRDLQLAAALKMNPGDGTLEGRVLESLRVYREMLKHKHGRNQAAGYTERDIKKHGPTGALIATIRRGKKTDGLKVLASFGRLDCSYEQIAVDFASELPDDVVVQAKAMLAELDAEKEEI